MITAEFEALLISTYKCYIIKPTSINWAADSDFVPDIDMIQVLTNNGDSISKCVRKKAEGVGTTAFFFRNTVSNQYFKVVLKNALATGQKRFWFF